MFVRGGSILPILLHPDCLSLLSCITNPIRVEVYPDSNGWAQGFLYVDDGETLKYRDDRNGHAWIQMVWVDNNLYFYNWSGN